MSNNKDSGFVSTLYVIPHPISPGQKDINLRWDFTWLREEDIEYIKPGCGCTAKIVTDSKGISAVYSDQTSPEDLEKQPHGILQVQKIITIYLKDSEPLQVNTPKGLLFNPKKQKIKIFFHASVV